VNNYDDTDPDVDDCIDTDMDYHRELDRRKEEYDQEMHHPLPCTPTSHMWEYLGGGTALGIYECTTCKQIEIESKGDL
jgi:hypothetical protein